jgi:DegV family protein with EDD domain
MLHGAETKTTQLNASEFEAYFEPFLQQGKDILHVCISSGISGTFNSANIAKTNLEEKYPERRILIADSLGGSSGYGLMMDQLADLKEAGLSMDELYAWIEERRLHIQHWFFSSDLTFFVKGGRISKASGLVGNLLNICPLIDVNAEGKMIPRFKIRTKRKVMDAIVQQMELLAEDGLDYSGKCYMSHSLCYEDARKVADMIEARFPKLQGPVEINPIGTIIGCHAGPGTVAIFFWGSKRV